VTLPEAKVVYGTYGQLNAAKDNVILLPSHYMANFHGYQWLIGPGKAFDPSKWFLVSTELFGNGRSSSPSNAPEPYHGPRFPVTTIRDNVEAVHRLLTEQLKVTNLRAIVGFSMGAEQAFQWAVSYPTFATRIVATSGTAKAYPHGVVRLESQIAALTTDPAFRGGDYTAPPARGLSAFGMVWAPWLYSQEWWRKELWRTNSPPGTTFEQTVERFRSRFLNTADANDIILQARTWERHDVGTTPGFGGDVEKALRSIQVPILYMPSETDLYFPVGDARYEAAFIPGVILKPIPSLWGHTAGAASNPADAKFLNENIARFLFAPQLDFLNQGRPVLDAHNCYPYQGTHADRIERALKTGTPVGIEQDLGWYVDPATKKGRVVVTHTPKTTGREPTLRDYFFERVRPIITRALAENDTAHWPLIVVHFDFKDNQAPLLHAVWDLLGEYQDWITTAPQTTDPHQLAAFNKKPLLVLTEDNDAQEEVFFHQIPPGAKLRLFGSAHTNSPQGKTREETIHLVATTPPEQLLTERPTNYRRWWNNSWYEVEEGGQPKSGPWTPAANERLQALVNRAHSQGFWIRFYTLDGFAPQDDHGWGPAYNFGSPEKVQARWQAALDAGVDLIASDQYEDLAAFMKVSVSSRK
jgi:homoserine O-acetyltransferase